MGFMAEIAQLWFAPGGTTEDYFDLSSALTAANRKQYHQVSKRGRPLCYDVTVEHKEASAAGADVSWMTAPNNWTVRNAVVKLSAAWKHQLKEAGIRQRDVSKYGRRLRLAFDKGMSTSGTGAMYGVCSPVGRSVSDGSNVELFEDYTTPAGDTVTYEGANEFTRLAIPDEVGAGDSVEMNTALLGYSESVGGNAYFGVVDEYLGSRGGVTDKPDSASQTPDATNLLQTLFSSTQPSTDEVIEAIEDYQEYRPYADGQLDATATPPTASKLCETATYHGKTSAGFVAEVPSPAAAVPHPNANFVSMKCPLGLIKTEGIANKAQFKITVHAIYEM